MKLIESTTKGEKGTVEYWRWKDSNVKKYIQSLGYYRYYEQGQFTPAWSLLKIDDERKVTNLGPGNKVDNSEILIALEKYLSNDSGLSTDDIAYDDLISSNKLTAVTGPAMLKRIQKREFKRYADSKKTAAIFYENAIVILHKDTTENDGKQAECIKWEDWPKDKLIWKTQLVKDRCVPERFIGTKFNVTDVSSSDSDISNVIRAAAGKELDQYKDKWETNYENVCKAIGVSTWLYKCDTWTKAIIWGDDHNSEIIGGGGAKTLIQRYIKQFRNVVDIGGSQGWDSTFWWGRVKPDTDVINISETREGEVLEGIRNQIDGDMEVEEKNIARRSIPKDISPRICITSNNTIGNKGTADTRRRVDVHLTNFFNEEMTPVKYLKRKLWDDYNEEQWISNDEFMFSCVLSAMDAYPESQFSEDVAQRELVARFKGAKLDEDVLNFYQDKLGGFLAETKVHIPEIITQLEELPSLKHKTVTYVNHIRRPLDFIANTRGYNFKFEYDKFKKLLEFEHTKEIGA